MKIDLTVNKKATINSGNYSSISPSVSIAVKDVDVSQTKDIYEKLNLVTSALFLSELSIMSELQGDLKTLGLKKFFEELEVEDMKNDLDEALESLKTMDWKVL